MADAYVREVGRVTDMDGVDLVVGVEFDTVTLGYEHLEKWRLPAVTAEEFAQLFVSACWQAGQQKARMDEEVPHDPAGERTPGHHSTCTCALCRPELA